MEENFELSHEAKLELHRALCYFKLYNQEDAFLDDFIQQLNRITVIPKAFQLRYKNVRIVQFKSFNYSIHFRVKTNGSILIYHILHQNQSF